MKTYHFLSFLFLFFSLTHVQAQHDPSHEEHQTIGFLAPVSDEKGGEPFFKIPELRSHDGQLSVDLNIQYSDFKIGKDSVHLRSYVLPELGQPGLWGPTLRVKPNDRMVVQIHNRLPHDKPYLFALEEKWAKELDKGKELSDDLQAVIASVAWFLDAKDLDSSRIKVVRKGKEWVLITERKDKELLLPMLLAGHGGHAHQSSHKEIQVSGNFGGHPDHNIPHDYNTTNLHVHGWHVSPFQDDVFRKVLPSFSSNYTYDLDNHTPGTFWYHPHVHGATAIQVASGMSGALIIEEDNLDAYPALAEASKPEHERILIFNQIIYDIETGTLESFDSLAKGAAPPRGTTINGIVKPQMEMRLGEVQRWRLIHSGYNTTLALGFDSTVFEVYQIAVDGIMFKKARRVRSVHMAPGNRTDLLVKMKQAAGDFPIYSITYMGACEYFPETKACKEWSTDSSKKIATVHVSGDPISMDFPTILPGPAPGHEDILSVVYQREIEFSFENGYSINGQPFKHDRIDQKPLLGTSEEWKIFSGHPYHIHVNPFQVWEYQGKKVNPPLWKDVIFVQGDSALVRTRYQKYWGDFVLHCHILYHEDQGMMQRVRIVQDCEESDLSEQQCTQSQLKK